MMSVICGCKSVNSIKSTEYCINCFQVKAIITWTKWNSPLCADRSLLSHSVTWWFSMRATSAQWPSSLSRKRRTIRSSHQPTLQVVNFTFRTVSTASLFNDRVSCLKFSLRCDIKYTSRCVFLQSRATRPQWGTARPSLACDQSTPTPTSEL